MKSKLVLVFAFLIIIANIFSIQEQNINYNDSWNKAGFTLESSSSFGVKLNHSIKNFSLKNINVDGKTMSNLDLPNTFLPNNEGAPNLPGQSRFIAIPEGATISFKVESQRVEILKNVELAPAPKIPMDSDDSPLVYEKDNNIYNKNSFYPENPILVSEITELRGVDMVKVGITPFQYNPATKELKIIRDIKVKINFNGGSRFGEDRLRSKWWDPIMNDMFVNSKMLPKIDYSNRDSKSNGSEYVIITPDAADFVNWADSLAQFRNAQGIKTEVYTITEVGGNTTTAIENFVDNAYNNWEIPPAAILLMADHGTSGNTIVSPTVSHPYSGSCISDNVYADVDGDNLPDITFARMTARNAQELENMVTKVLRNERTPSENPDYYNNPITACGWQTERWFQIGSEVIGGFWENELGKDRVRINEIYDGYPSTDPWSTADNTQMVLDYFGPNGLGYIPESPSDLGGWSGGNATDINNALNSGAFMLQHRDHGGENGWGEPEYLTSDLSGLDNEDLPFIFSINCLTGKFDWSSDSFTEVLHRMDKGALGVLAATEISYSFVNDTFIWGLYDYMWPEFMPEFGSNPESRGILPAFSNVAGKYFLEQSSWPYNTEHKEITYKLFHHHGDPFTTVYSEMPQNLVVNNNSVILSGTNQFEITADEGALISLSVDGEIIGSAIATGSTQMIAIEPQIPPTNVKLVVTKQNYYRYEQTLNVIPPSGPYVVYNSHTVNDLAGNNNGTIENGETILLDFSVLNVGSEGIDSGNITITTEDEYTTIIDGEEALDAVGSEEIVAMEDIFEISVANANVPNEHTANFSVEITSGDYVWESGFSLEYLAPELEYNGFSIDDSATGNNNGRLDPGETVLFNFSVENTGSANALITTGLLTSTSQYVTLNEDLQNYGEIAPDEIATQSYSVTISENAPTGTLASFNIEFVDGNGYATVGDANCYIGQIPYLIIDLDTNNNSANEIEIALNENGLEGDYVTSFPSEELDIYASIFVCLGIYSNNTALSDAQGTELASYLNNGGSIYMEGGDTWSFATPTPVHPMFNINGDSDGSSDLSTITGQASTFAEGMSFAYGGENSWIDQLSPNNDAFAIFKNESAGYSCTIANDAETYKTIGSSYEFGGLTDSESPSTKADLMHEYLVFLGVLNNGPTYNPVQNVAFTIENLNEGQIADDIVISWEAPQTSEFTLEGYNVYQNDNLVNEELLSDLNMTHMDQAIGIYSYAVEAVYFEGVSIKISIEVEITSQDSMNPPQNLTFTNNNNNEVILLWEAPAENKKMKNFSTNKKPTYLKEKKKSRIVKTKNRALLGYKVYRDSVEIAEIENPEILTYTDSALDTGNYSYYITAIYTDGESVSSNIVEVALVNANDMIKATKLVGNYPNPFSINNAARTVGTTISFTIKELSDVKIDIFNIKGQKVKTLVDDKLDKAQYDIKWNGKDNSGRKVTSGIYFYKMNTTDYISTKKMILIK